MMMNYSNQRTKLYIYILLLIAKFKKLRAALREKADNNDDDDSSVKETPVLVKRARGLIEKAFDIIEDAVKNNGGDPTHPDFIKLMELKPEILKASAEDDLERVITILIRFLKRAAGIP